MQSKRPRVPAAVRKKRRRVRKPKPGAVKGERLKPISLYPFDFDMVLRKLLSPTSRPSGK